MTHKEKADLINSLPTIGYWYEGLNGAELKKLEDRPRGTYAYIKDNVGCSNPDYHILKIREQYTSDGAHLDNIYVNGRRLYFKDCIKA